MHSADMREHSAARGHSGDERPYDTALMVAIVILMGIGTVMIYSASIYIATQSMDDGTPGPTSARHATPSARCNRGL